MNTILRSKFPHGKLLFLAPMDGITNAVYRDLAVENMNMDVVCTQFIRLSGSHFSPKQIRDELNFYQKVTLSVQLMGDNPKLFAECVPYLIDLGVKIIDLNLGCPSPRVNRKSCGAAMLNDLKLLSEVASHIRKICTVLFSVKMRAGWDSSDNAIKIAQLLEKEGIDFITVHPRTRMQKYQGTANRDIIYDIKKSVSIPIIANGDIFSSQSAFDMIEKTNSDGIMLGRGVLRDPFLLNKVNTYLSCKKETQIKIDSYKKFYLTFIERMLVVNSEKTVLNKAKEHIKFFLSQIKNAKLHWSIIKHLQYIEDFTDYLKFTNLELNQY